MYYELYIDSFFVRNLVMDYFLLLLSARLLSCKVTNGRLFLGAVIGSVFSCILILLPGIPGTVKITVGYVLINIAMLRSAFGMKKIKLLLRGAAYLYLASFIIGGFLDAFTGIIQSFGIDAIPFFGIALVSYLLVLACLYGIKKKKIKSENLFRDVELVIGSRHISVKGLIDTGNSLLEPISRKPVSILSGRVVEEEGIVFAEENFRIIPFHSIGKTHGCLDGHVIDRMIITSGDEEVVIEKAILGISRNEISSQQGYDLILHPDYQKG